MSTPGLNLVAGGRWITTVRALLFPSEVLYVLPAQQVRVYQASPQRGQVRSAVSCTAVGVLNATAESVSRCVVHNDVH